ncbi:MAG: isopenicillin N synthase family oxygenase [Rhizobiales bacterium]|nr:isopenicillin N synthase family oxygenase [Hyphomicrobiales bacterium]
MNSAQGPSDGAEATLPIIDFTGWQDDAAVERTIAKAIDAAFCSVGFCYFTNTGVDPALVARLFEMSRRFHAQPMERKLEIAMNAYHRGYMAPDSETVADSSVAEVTKPNFSESYMFMHDIGPDDPRWGHSVHGPNQWPADVPGFRETVLEYQAAMQAFSMRLLRTFEIALDLPDRYFDPYFARPTTFLRLLHYPPRPANAHTDAFGIAPHTDFGFLTLLAQDGHGGLEVRKRGGGWISAPPVPGAFVVNVADVLARWTNGRWQSTPHRVVHNSAGHRYSCPYFFDTDVDVPVDCMPSCTSPDNPPRYEPATYGAVLERHLVSNYTYRKEGP